MIKRGKTRGTAALVMAGMVLLIQGCSSLPYRSAKLDYDCMHMLNYDDKMMIPKYKNTPFNSSAFVSLYNEHPETAAMYETSRAVEFYGITLIVLGLGSMIYGLYSIFGNSFTSKSVETGLAAVGISVPLSVFGAGFLGTSKNSDVEALYLHNVLSKKEEYRKKLSMQCPDYYYPVVDVVGNLNIKGYFEGVEYHMTDVRLQHMSLFNPVFQDASKYALLPVVFTGLTIVSMPLLIVGPILGSFLISNAQSDLYRLYFDTINLYNYNCFCAD